MVKWTLIFLLFFVSPAWPAQLALISEVTHKFGVQELNDIVEIRKDLESWTPFELRAFTIIQIPNVTKKQLIQFLYSKYPERQTISGKDYWWNGTTWMELKKQHKFKFSLDSLISKELEDLQSEVLTKEQKQSVLDKISIKDIDDPQNNLSVLP